ncbi:MAG: LOG family protein [cyanobacterium endosymbiont of Rhopalodia musculus]|uniref:LOG family protein n=1 Tax=cyanobacterium endosymbiont of Epithemia clementina EcSB TaxID=3034674 RepID=UPI00247FEE1D|nr:LOG family protein [cyanobacterium endosymbiont of Epithemia clementina EcSB]WGT67523.1 LOG family protein [cyanobacterium endosymbiont of Epithemia clementina EcSB]
MTLSKDNIDPSLAKDIGELIAKLSEHQHGTLVKRALSVLLRIAGEEIDRLDWKILTAALEDLEQGFQTFYPYRHIRKVTIFGSSRLSPQSSEYHLAVEFSRCITQFGFMVLTGGGGGIMQAGNEGAGPEHSFGLNIQLPFEQSANPFIADDPKLINFKYFFTRKLFFLRESDAVALFAGGFGTQDEVFETLTLSQTGKYGPCPLVLIDEPGGDYWKTWNEHNQKNLLRRGLINTEDFSLYTVTDNLAHACNVIHNFYCVYHSSRYVGDLFVMRLNLELSDEQVDQLNDDYSDILVKETICKSAALPSEKGDETESLPRLVFHFDQRNFGRLYQMINQINQYSSCLPVEPHPEWK